MINAKDALERMAQRSIDYEPMCLAIYKAIDEGACSVEYFWRTKNHRDVIHNHMVSLGYRVWMFEDFILIQW